MLDIFRDWFERVRKARTFPIVIVYVLLIGILVYRLFSLQIVNTKTITEKNENVKEKDVLLKGTRGNIYDCNGELLAYNELAYSVTMVDSGELKTSEEINSMIYRLLQILDKYDCKVDTEFPIDINKKGKMIFTVEGTALKNFKRDAYCASSVEKLKEEQLNATAEEMFAFLRSNETESPKFNISDKYTEEEALRIMAIRYELFLNRYQKYKTITVASNVDEQIRVAIEENSADLPGVEITKDTYRKYTKSYYFSHIIGYTGGVSDSEIEEITGKKISSENKEKVYQKAGYTTEDQIGKTGLEKEYEKYLHGDCGSETITVSAGNGRVLDSKDLVEAAYGNDLYLTIDSELQVAAYDMLEKELANILYGKIQNTKYAGSRSDNLVIPIYDVYYALVNNNVIDITKLNRSSASDTEKRVYQTLENRKKTVIGRLKNILGVNSTKTANQLSEEYAEYQEYVYKYLKDEGILMSDADYKSSKIYEQYCNDKVSFSEFFQKAIANNWLDLSALDIGSDYYSSTELYEKLMDYVFENIKQEKSFDKKIYYHLIYEGSVTGTQLCLILYDQKVLKYSEEKVTGLSAGTISAFSFIKDQIRTLKITPAQLALDPCSGSVIVTDPDTGNVKACVSYPGYDTNRYANKIDTDYYFQVYEDLSEPTIFRAVQHRTAPGSTYKPLVAIAGLTEGYISLGEKISCHYVFDKEVSGRHPKCWYTGAHGSLDVSGGIANSCNIFFYTVGWRMSDSYTNHEKGLGILRKYASEFGFDAKSGISSAELDPQISDLDTVYSAIGQGTNNYTPSQISRYVTTLVNKKNCYDLNIVSKVQNTKGKEILKNKTGKVHHEITNISDSTWNAVYKGMYNVVNGPNSSIDQYFEYLKDDMKIEVAGKTGTAQEGEKRANHGLFMSFAPYNNPEICTTVAIPRGYTSANAAKVASDVYEYYFAKNASEKKKVIDKVMTQSGSGAASSARVD